MRAGLCCHAETRDEHEWEEDELEHLNSSHSIYSATKRPRRPKNAVKLSMCRLASRLHFELLLTPVTVLRRMEKVDLKVYYKNTYMRSCMRYLIIIMMFLGIATLPILYANQQMDYPCEDKQVKIDEQLHELAKTGCEAQDALRNPLNPLGGGIGVIAILCGLCLTIVYGLLTEVLRSCGLFRLKRMLWKLPLMLWYFYIDARCPNLKYFNDHNLLVCIYSPPSVLISFVIFFLASLILSMGVYYGDITTGIVLAGAVPEFILGVLNWIYGLIGSDFINAVHTHLDDPPDGAGGSAFQKIRSTIEQRSSILRQRGTDLPFLKELEWVFDGHGKDYTQWQAAAMQKDKSDHSISDQGDDDFIGYMTEAFVIDLEWNQKNPPPNGDEWEQIVYFDLVNKTSSVLDDKGAQPVRTKFYGLK